MALPNPCIIPFMGLSELRLLPKPLKFEPFELILSKLVNDVEELGPSMSLKTSWLSTCLAMCGSLISGRVSSPLLWPGLSNPVVRYIVMFRFWYLSGCSTAMLVLVILARLVLMMSCGRIAFIRVFDEAL